MGDLIYGAIPEWTGYGDGSGYGDGYGDGSGYGYGDGDGDGNGYGNGYGDGYGYGDGDGSGYGDGYGYGYGDGSGYGYGYGYGSGDGSGYGSGYGSGDGWRRRYEVARQQWPKAVQDRLAEVEHEASVIAFWRSNEAGNPANGGKCEKSARPGLVQEISGPLVLCTSGALHATMQPDKWKGARVWVVALFGEVTQDGDKFGALKREIIGEITDVAA